MNRPLKCPLGHELGPPLKNYVTTTPGKSWPLKARVSVGFQCNVCGKTFGLEEISSVNPEVFVEEGSAEKADIAG